MDSVQGKSPLEFDGTELNNIDSGSHVAQRIIGKHAVNNPAHGTAEPEMRGLYMLLTMNNEGGMEVLKYAAKLFQERPEVYHSIPVQLSLEIFKVCAFQYKTMRSPINSNSLAMIFVFPVGKERLQLRSFLFDTSVPIHPVLVLLHHVQARRDDAQGCLSNNGKGFRRS